MIMALFKYINFEAIQNCRNQKQKALKVPTNTSKVPGMNARQ